MFDFRSRPFGLQLTPSREQAKRRRHPARPVAQTLESRLLLSTYQVTSLADVASSSPQYDGTLRWAIQQANTHAGADTITFATGLNGTIDLQQGPLSLISGTTTIIGPGASTLTISGYKVSAVFVVLSGATAAISGMTLTDAVNSAIQEYNATLTLSGMTITNSTGGKGGGIANSGTLTIDNCTISNDSATGDGGGIWNSGMLTVNGNSTISHDVANSADGGGIYNIGTANVSDSTLSTDTANSDGTGNYLGGGIYSDGTLTVAHSTLSGDEAVAGGGIYNGGGTATVSNSTLSNNVAVHDIAGGNTTNGANNGGNIFNAGAGTLDVIDDTLSGGESGNGDALYNDGGTVTVTHSTFSNDSGSGSSGGGIFNIGGTLSLTDSTVSNDGDFAGIFNAGGGGKVTVSGGAITNDVGGIYNSFGDTVIVTDCNISNEAPYIDGFSPGGGIFNGGTLTATGCTLSNDTSGDNTSAIDNTGTITITNCTVSNNSIENGYNPDGGGLTNAGTATVSSSTFSDNSVNQYGAGMYNTGALTVKESTISGDDSVRDGAGIYNGGSGTLVVTNCDFSNDSASDIYVPGGSGGGGGIYSAGMLTITNSTFAGDSTTAVEGTADGGGVYDAGTLEVFDSTFATNSASGGGGGGIYVGNGAKATLDNTIVARNSATDGDSDIQGKLVASSAYNLIGELNGVSGITKGANGNQADVNPDLGPLADNGGPTQTMALLAGSPAIDHGSNGLIPSGVTTDQRGYIRIANATVDIGAYEFGAAPLGTPLIVTTPQDDVDYTPGQLTLRQAVSLADATSGAASITFALADSGNSITLTQGHLSLSNTSGKTTITGPGASTLTIGGNGAGAVFVVHSGVSAAMSGMTLTDATNSAIQEYNATLTLSGMTIINSTGGRGGGIANSGLLTVNNCTISNDSATGDGGGIWNNGTLRVNNCTLSGDSTTASGGGIDNSGTLTVTNSTLSNGSATIAGGGISNNDTLTVVNSTFFGDSAAGGGGIYSAGTLNVFDSTLVDNSAALIGGGMFVGSGTALLDNTIVAGNIGGSEGDNDVAGTLLGTSGYNLIGNGTGMTGISNGANGNQVGTAASAINPVLGPLANNGGPTQTLTPLPGSPAIERGSIALIPSGVTTDQRGLPRIVNDTVDIGAVEVQTPPAATTVIVDDTAATLVGVWTSSTFTPGYYGTDYLTDGNTGKGTKTATFTPALTAAGTYQVFARWTAGSNRATNVPIVINSASGSSMVTVNQQLNDNTWVLLGTYTFNLVGGSVMIENAGTNGYVIADAVEFVPV